MSRTLVPDRRDSARHGRSAEEPLRVEPISLHAPRKRRPSWVLAGAVLVALSALLGAWVFTTTSDTMKVLVAAKDLAPGDVVQADDLRVVELGRSNGLRAIQPSDQALVIGLAARGPVPAGTVLNTDLFVERDRVIPSGFVVVGAALEPGAAPTSELSSGDRLVAIAVSKTASAPEVSTAATVLTTATVWNVESVSANSGDVWLSLLVPAEAQTAVAQAAADGMLRISLTGADP